MLFSPMARQLRPKQRTPPAEFHHWNDSMLRTLCAAALTRLGARKAREIVMLTCRLLQPSRTAMSSIVAAPAPISDSHCRPGRNRGDDLDPGCRRGSEEFLLVRLPER